MGLLKVASSYGDVILNTCCNFTTRGCLAVVGLLKKFLLVMVGVLSR